MKTIVISEQSIELPEEAAPTIIRPAIGSPYYIDSRTGHIVFLSRPGAKFVTSEDVARGLEDFP
jgi:hypothetical protein